MRQDDMTFGAEGNIRCGTIFFPLCRNSCLAVVQHIAVDAVDEAQPARVSGMIQDDQIVFARRGAQATPLALHIADHRLCRPCVDDAGTDWETYGSACQDPSTMASQTAQ